MPEALGLLGREIGPGVLRFENFGYLLQHTDDAIAPIDVVLRITHQPPDPFLDALDVRGTLMGRIFRLKLRDLCPQSLYCFGGQVLPRFAGLERDLNAAIERQIARAVRDT